MERDIPKKIFFWTLVCLFFITSTLIISYAFGYRYSLDRGIFVHAGSVTLKTTPQNVDVYINGIFMPSKILNRLNNSYHIGGIKPGNNYLIEIKSPGYSTWSKRMSIHSGVSTEFWNIILTKNNYTQTDYNTPQIGRFFISPRKNLVALTQQEQQNFSVKVLDTSDDQNITTDTVFFANDLVFTNDEKENIEWSPQAHRLIVPVIKENLKRYFIVDIKTKETFDLKDIVEKENVSHVRWDPDTKNALFYIWENTLYRVDLDAPEEKKEIAQNVGSYDLSSDGLFYFQLPSGIVYRTNFTGSSTPEQITTSAPFDMSDDSYQIITYDRDRITFINKSGRLYIFNKGKKDTYFNELSNNSLASQFSDDGKKLLFWNDKEISTYYIRDWEVQPVRVENETISVTRFSQTIKNVQWARDYEHAIFSTGNKLKIIEIDYRDNSNLMDIMTFNNDDAKAFGNFSDGRIYYIDDNEKKEKTLKSMEFPEKTSFLGLQN